MSSHCDIAVVGGGPVGIAFALALRDSGLHVVILEAGTTKPAAVDPRALALSYGSRQLLDRLGVWKDLSQVSPIKTIHVSQKNSFGRTLLQAKDLDIPELGYVLPYATLQGTMQDALLRADELTHLTDAAVTSLQSNPTEARVTYRHAGHEHQLEAQLAVVADGGRLLKIAHPPKVSDYGQSAVIAHVTCAHHQSDMAFERFTTQGPLALLPFRGGYELVWTVAHELSQEVLHWDDDTFLAKLHQHFGDRVGKFLTVGRRACFPLQLKRAVSTTLSHTVLIGNAAQTLHPVAGQGFNMGLRDAWELAQGSIGCATGTLGSDATLANYRKQRQIDRHAGIGFTDGLVRLFSNEFSPLKIGRAAALSALDCFPGAKKFMAKRMMFGANG